MHFLDDIALLLGRLFLAALFLPSGLQKAADVAATTALLDAKGLPYPHTLAICAAAAELGGAIALILGMASRLTALVLIAFVVGATVTTHLFWLQADAVAEAAQKIMFFKNLAIAGGLLFYFASGPGAIALERTPSTQR